MKYICLAITILLIFPVLTNSEDKIADIINAIDENSLYQYVKAIQDFGEHVTGSEKCNEVAEFIYNKFKEAGLEVSYHEWSSEGYKGKNVIATLPGKTNSSIILSAHYDSYPTSPGADDDGSGIACLLMASQIFSKYNFLHTIKLIAFSGEEQGMLGSKEYVKEAYRNGEDIIADINVDTVGHAVSKDGGSKLRVLTDEASIWITDIAEEVSEKYNLGISLFRHGNFPAGDHQSFLDYGYEAVFFVEYEFNSNMHTPNDTIEHVNISYLTKACKLVLAATARIADKSFSIRIKFDEPKIGNIYINDRKIMQIEEPYTIVIGRIHTSVKLMGNEEVKRVEFYFDGKLIGFSDASPYEYVYNNIAFFKHSIKAVAVANNSDICKMDVIVFNFLPPGPPHG